MKYSLILSFQLLTILSLRARGSIVSSGPDSTAVLPEKSAIGITKTTAFERHKWDASVDASFVLPSFYQVYANGYYGNNAYNYGNGPSYGNGVRDYSYYGSSGTFTNSRSTRFMLRKNESVVSPTNIPLRKGAYRLQLYIGGGYAAISDDSVRLDASSQAIYYLEHNSSITIGTALGYEWQQQMGRFQLFYGYDIFLRYNSSLETGSVRTNSANGGLKDATSYDYHALSAGVAPLAGVKFFISSQFSLSLETTYSISYYSGETKFKGPSYYYGHSYKEAGLSYGLTPVSAINATFHFGQTNP